MKKHFPLLKYKTYKKTDRIEDIRTCDEVIIYSKLRFIIRTNYPSIANKIVIWAENKRSFIQKIIA